MINWPTKKLGDVLDYEQPGKYIVSSKHYSSEYKTPVLTAGKTFILGNTNENKNIFPADKLPVIIFDDFTTATKFVDFPFKVKSSAMKILHAKKGKADAKFLFYAMQTLKLNHNTHKRYWISEYSNLEIPLPPLPTQKKIVAKVEKLLAKIKEAKRLRAEAQVGAQNLLPAALHKIFEEGKKKGWKEKMLGEICGNTANIKWSEHKNKSYYYIDLSSVSRDNFSITETKQVNFKNAPSRAKKIIITNDVIFGTTRPTLMRVTVIPPEYDNNICSTGFVVLRAQKEHALPQFIYYFIRSERFIERMEKIQTGASYPAVSDAKVLETKIPLPPLVEQKKIVAYLDALSAKAQQIQTLQAQTAQDLGELEQAVLRQTLGVK